MTSGYALSMLHYRYILMNNQRLTADQRWRYERNLQYAAMRIIAGDYNSRSVI